MVSSQSILLSIKVVPKAKVSAIVGKEGGYLKVRLAAIPEKGQANQELITLLIKTLEISKQQVQLVRGETSRLKVVAISGLSLEELEQRLSNR